MRGRLLVVLGIAVAFLAEGASADWTQFQAGAGRSGANAQSLDVPLWCTWSFQPLQGPKPAWPQPGRELHRVDFDYTFEPVIAAGTVFFGSSADDTLYALDAESGKQRWHVTTGGPIRFAPAVWQGRIYVASDDGYVRCLDAQNGDEVWAFRAAPDDDQLLGNSRMISRWPLRAGLVLKDGVLYTSAGMWPSEGIHVYALDAGSGEVLWVNNSSGDMYMDLPHPGASAFTGVAPQGYLTVVGDALIVPTGRSVPAAFDTYTGAFKHYNASLYRSDGSSWVAGTEGLYFCAKHGSGPDLDVILGESDPRPGDGLKAFHADTGKQAFALENRHRAAIDGRLLVASGGGVLEAYDLDAIREDSDPLAHRQWSTPMGRTYVLALTKDLVFCGGRGEVHAAKRSSGEVVWSADVDGNVRSLVTTDSRLIAATDKGQIFNFEHFPMRVPMTETRMQPAWKMEAPGEYGPVITRLLELTECREGYALVVGAADTRPATSLAVQSDLHVIAAIEDAGRVQAYRDALLPTGLYGSRIVVQALAPGKALPYAPYFADVLLVTGDATPLKGDQLLDCVRPCGGVLALHGLAPAEVSRILAETGLDRSAITREGDVVIARRPALAGAGSWRFQWGDPGRTGVGTDQRVRLPLRQLWFGGPGPARMMTRHWGTSTPLSVNGRVFVTAQHEILAFDAYTGRELWSAPIENIGRKGAVWQSSNFAADDESLYTCVGQMCFRIDQATGKMRGHYRMPSIEREKRSEVEEAAQVPSVAVEWPRTWTVFGPLPKEHAGIPSESLRTIPARIVEGEREFLPVQMDAVNGKLDFASIAPPGKTVMEWVQMSAYAFGRIRVQEDGLLRFGAGADWWMQWYLDGEPLTEKMVTGYGDGIRTHVLEADVTAGEHVLAAHVKSGSMGWMLVSAGGRMYDRFLEARETQPIVEDAAWEYLSVNKELVLGSIRPPGGLYDKLPTAVFALEKNGGATRWIWHARHGVPASGMAFDETTLFILDETPVELINQAERRGTAIEERRDLIAIDLESGEEVWRQSDVPELSGRAPSVVQVSQGVVVANGGNAYDAKTGRSLWQEEVICGRSPVILGDWIVAMPHAYNLHTGAIREVADPITGVKRPWTLARAYGCGSVAGCPNVLFFRSGTFGFYDFLVDGTTTYGGARPNCSVSMIGANGVVILPEASAACACSYNFQTSLALYPCRAERVTWYAFSGQDDGGKIRAMRLNFGAPGDQRDAEGHAWLGYPRPWMPGHSPVPVGVLAENPAFSFDPDAELGPPDALERLLYSSGMRGKAKLLIDLESPQAVAAGRVTTAPAIDGELTEAAWAAAVPAEFAVQHRREEPHERLVLLQDDAALYLGYREVALSVDGSPVPFTGSADGQDDAMCGKDDRLEIMLSNTGKTACIYLVVSCAGGRFDAKGKPGGVPDGDWDGEWTSAVASDASQWSTEIALPFSTIREAGLDPAALVINAMVSRARPKGEGESIYLVDPGRWGFDRGAEFVSVRPVVPEIAERHFTVRVHVPARDAAHSGMRVTVGAEEQTVDAGAATGAPATVLEFDHVAARRWLAVGIAARTEGAGEPALCALEVIEE